LLDFDLFTGTKAEREQALWRFEMRDAAQPDVVLGSELQLTVIELKKADRLGQLQGAAGDWVSFFEHWREETVMGNVTHEPVKKAMGSIRQLSADEEAQRLAEAREAYKVETWARKIGITRQVLVNDDLGAFADLARRMGQAAADARDDEGGEIGGDQLPCRAVALNEVLEVDSVNILHRHIVLPADLPEMVGLHDVGVDEVGDEPGLANKVVAELLDPGVFLTDQFHRHALYKLASAILLRLIDDAHAALGNHAHELEM
jgi:hypothetical protein